MSFSDVITAHSTFQMYCSFTIHIMFLLFTSFIIDAVSCSVVFTYFLTTSEFGLFQ